MIVPDLPECDDEEDTGDEIPNTPVMPVTPFTPPLVDPRGVDPRSPNPLNGLGWYVDKSRWVPQWRQYRHFQRSGQRGKAAMLGKIALQPQFRWFGRWNEDEQGGIAGVMRALPATRPEGAARHGAADRDAAPPGQGSATRATRPAARRRTRARSRWFRTFARGVGTARVVIGFEPDSVGTINCLARSPAQGPHGRAALRHRRAVAAAQRHDLHRGDGVRLDQTTGSWPSGCATSGSRRCAGSCST